MTKQDHALALVGGLFGASIVAVVMIVLALHYTAT